MTHETRAPRPVTRGKSSHAGKSLTIERRSLRANKARGLSTFAHETR